MFINPNSKGECGCGESFMTTSSKGSTSWCVLRCKCIKASATDFVGSVVLQPCWVCSYLFLFCLLLPPFFHRSARTDEDCGVCTLYSFDSLNLHFERFLCWKSNVWDTLYTQLYNLDIFMMCKFWVFTVRWCKPHCSWLCIDLQLEWQRKTQNTSNGDFKNPCILIVTV